jgi:hypothetical protein
LADLNTKNNLWYDFDNFYLWEPDADTSRWELDVLRFSDYSPLGTLTLDNLNKILASQDAGKLVESVNNMINPYLKIFDDHFGTDFERQEVISSFALEVFRDFGLGVLYDPRLPRTNKRHMHLMDGGLGSYARWHRFNWVASILQSQSIFVDSWIL